MPTRATCWPARCCSPAATIPRSRSGTASASPPWARCGSWACGMRPSPPSAASWPSTRGCAWTSTITGARGSAWRRAVFFHALEMRPVVTAPGTVDLEIDVLERRGFGGVPYLVGRGIADLTREKVRLRYANLGPRDHRRRRVQVGGDPALPADSRWTRSARSASRACVSIDGMGARPTYDLEDGSGPFRLRTHGGGVRGRVVSPAARWPRPACASVTAPGTSRDRTRRMGRSSASSSASTTPSGPADATTSRDRSGP